MRVQLSCLPFLTLLLFQVKAQPPILPELFGDELIEQLSIDYAPANLLNFTQVKDTLYAVIDRGPDDSVRCIYTNRALFLQPGTDPSQAVFQDGSGINLEHIWPQSKGAGDGKDGQTDMHHLAPSRVDVNSMRANNPFNEIPDNQTDKWYYLNQSLISAPTSMIEVYSEADELFFEPKEDRKGDIARAMFYFFAIHNDDADKPFFEGQISTLCAWHIADPVDQRELERSEHIAAYQGNINPFLLDCTLPARAFCGDKFNCTTSAVQAITDTSIEVRIHRCTVVISSENALAGTMVNRMFSVNGTEHLRSVSKISNGSNGITIDVCDLPRGIYFLTTEMEQQGSRLILPTKQVLIY